MDKLSGTCNNETKKTLTKTPTHICYSYDPISQNFFKRILRKLSQNLYDTWRSESLTESEILFELRKIFRRKELASRMSTEILIYYNTLSIT